MKKLTATLMLLACVMASASAFHPSNFFYRTSPAGAPLKMEPVYYAPRPKYAAEAQQNRWQGQGLFELHIDPAGRVQAVNALKSTGHSALDTAAIEALREWRFRPNSIDIVRVPLEYKITARVTRTGQSRDDTLKAQGNCDKGLIVAHPRR